MHERYYTFLSHKLVATVAFVESAYSVREGGATVIFTQLVCLEVMLPVNSALERDVVAQVTPSDGTASKIIHRSYLCMTSLTV